MKVKGHAKRVNLIVEPKSNVCNPSVVIVPSYANLRQVSSKVSMSFRNLTSKDITVNAKLIVAQVATANVVPAMLTPKNYQDSEKQDERTNFPGMNSEAPIKVQLTKDQLKNCLIKLT